MDYEQADKILDTSQRKPTTREDQIKLIRILGYNRLRNSGNRRLEDCDDNQIHAVARDYHQKAVTAVNNYWSNIDKERFEQDYHAHLCEILNIPFEDREEVSIDDLERELAD